MEDLYFAFIHFVASNEAQISIYFMCFNLFVSMNKNNLMDGDQKSFQIES